MPELAIRVNMPREMGWLEKFQWGGTVILPAHILETFKMRAAQMVRRLGCPYVIDPHTHVFGGTTGEIAGRRWFDRLVAEYGISMESEPGLSPLAPGALVKNGDPTDALRDLVQNVTEYQNSAIPDARGEVGDYEDFESGGGDRALNPERVVPPYFYMEDGGSDWLAVNVRSIELASKSSPAANNLHSMIMVDQDVLSDARAVDEIVSAYSALPVAGHMVWVARMNEARARVSELVGLQEFIGRLSQGGKPVYNAYGGLFSLANDRLSGTSHAICYGEHRNPLEAPGAVLLARFYLPALHSKVPYARRHEVSRALGLDECGCKWCKMSEAGAGMGNLEHAALHFLDRRAEDVAQIEKTGGGGFLDHLKSVHDSVSDADMHGAYEGYYGHFKTWHQAVASYNRRKEDGRGEGQAITDPSRHRADERPP